MRKKNDEDCDEEITHASVPAPRPRYADGASLLGGGAPVVSGKTTGVESILVPSNKKFSSDAIVPAGRRCAVKVLRLCGTSLKKIKKGDTNRLSDDSKLSTLRSFFQLLHNRTTK